MESNVPFIELIFLKKNLIMYFTECYSVSFI